MFFLAVIGILLLQCACVPAQLYPFGSPHIHPIRFHQVEPSFLGPSHNVHVLPPPQVHPAYYDFQLPGSSQMSRMVKLLVVASVINRITKRKSPVTEQPITFFSFTNCGKNGTTGPNLQECQANYGTEWSNDANIYNVVDGVQTFKVFRGGRYRFEAYGAQGGMRNEFAGGKGAKMIGEFVLNEGTMLNIVIGQKGSDGINSFSAGAGGGGGTFVYSGSIGGNGLLIAAAGGGGALFANVGFDGQSGLEAISFSGFSGHEGFGGIGGHRTSAGAGWRSDGSPNIPSVTAAPGERWNGGDIDGNDAGDGGFGGGGSGVYVGGGGGGGGYTGGDGVADEDEIDAGGSGGGSFNAGENQNNMSGINTGHGRFEMTYLSDA